MMVWIREEMMKTMLKMVKKGGKDEKLAKKVF